MCQDAKRFLDNFDDFITPDTEQTAAKTFVDNSVVSCTNALRLLCNASRLTCDGDACAPLGCVVGPGGSNLLEAGLVLEGANASVSKVEAAERAALDLSLATAARGSSSRC